jgi:two-component system chemotaxis response regulator CheY
MRTIWIVDDDDEMSGAIKLMLEVMHCEALIFPNAKEAAQALLAGQQPDLLLLDINMPEVSGLDFLEFVRRRAEWTHLPVLMLSTEAADDTVDRAIGLGADGYLTKPATIEELERAVNAALYKRQKGMQ